MFEDLFTQRITGKNTENDSGTDRPLRGVILSSPGSFDEEVFVFIETLGENARRGPCVWQPIIDEAGTIYTPTGGEECIVQFDTETLPWVVEWVPDAGSHKIPSAALSKLAKAENLKDVANVVTARTNLGLGSAATHNFEDFDVKGAAAEVKAELETEKKRAEEAEKKPPLVSALPGSPVDGQEIYYQNATMAGIALVWHLRYRAASAQVNKWECIGGIPWLEGPLGSVNKKTEAGEQLPSGPKITVPATGVYDVGHGIRVETLGASVGSIVCAPWVNGASAGMTPLEWVHSEAGGNFWGSTLGMKYQRVGLTAGQVLTLGISQNPATEVNYQQGFLSLMVARL